MVSGIFTIPFDVPQATSVLGRSGGSRSRIALREYIGGPENSLVLFGRHGSLAGRRQPDAGTISGKPNLPLRPDGTAKTELCHYPGGHWQRSHPKRSVKMINGASFRRGYSTAVGRNNVTPLVDTFFREFAAVPGRRGSSRWSTRDRGDASPTSRPIRFRRSSGDHHRFGPPGQLPGNVASIGKPAVRWPRGPTPPTRLGSSAQILEQFCPVTPSRLQFRRLHTMRQSTWTGRFRS